VHVRLRRPGRLKLAISGMNRKMPVSRSEVARMSESAALTPDELAMARHLVEALGLDGVDAAGIAPEAMLFGSHADGLGLDSIDALEIALMVQQKYGVELRSEDPEARAAFASLRSLTQHVLAHRAA
jgi:acyl carrier protein